jgi:hypothetical protein
MDTYFIRHEMNASDATLRRLECERRVGIHFPRNADGVLEAQDLRSTDPEKQSPNGRGPMDRLLTLAREGGFVCAVYPDLVGCAIGKVEPGTPVEFFEGQWREPPDRVAVLKSLRMSTALHLSQEAAASILAVRPRRGTICRWHKVGDRVQRLVQGADVTTVPDPVPGSPSAGQETSPLDTHYIRHTSKLDVTNETLRRLAEAGRIAIHFPRRPDGSDGDADVRSLDPEDHTPDGGRCLARLHDLGASGGYVCAEYRSIDYCVVGRVAPGSRVEFFDGEWRSRPGRVAVLKSLQLTTFRTIPADAAVPMLVARPRQGTFMKWPRVGRAVERLVEGLRPELCLDDLSPSQQEILCSEFLRLPEAVDMGLPRLVHLVLPPGRTMPAIDLLGVAADGQPIYAQVTFGRIAEVHRKLEKLKPFTPGHRILFADASEPSNRDDIHIVPIREVFRRFVATTHGTRWIEIACPTASLE